MHHDFEQATIDPKHVLVEPPGGPDDVADLVVAARGAGLLRYRVLP